MSRREFVVNQLHVGTAIVDGRASTLFVVDGADLLRLQRPRHRPDGSPYPSGPKIFQPADPVDVLPPDSAALLPFDVAKQALVGVCSCGEAGCGSLWLQVRRDGPTVLWEPDPQTVRSTIDTTWRFALGQYLDALADGHRSTASWETRPRLLARELRRRRDSLSGFSMGSSRAGTGADLTRARAWPGHDYIAISAVGERRWSYRLAVPDHLSDEQIITAMRRLDPDLVRLDD